MLAFRPDFLRTTWLPRWRSKKNPSRFKSFTALHAGYGGALEGNGTLAQEQASLFKHSRL
jgi:hypothetical protein